MKKTIRRLSALTLLLLLPLTGNCAQADQALLDNQKFTESQKIDKTNKNWKTNLNKPNILTFSKDKKYLWSLETTEGTLILELYPDIAPMHVSSTIYLTELGFYDDLIFHRVIPGFMAQGGDPLGRGTGNPGYRYAGEFVEGNKKASHHKAGILSMANAGPNTDGSQFFLTFKSTPFLNGRHTVFGEVIQGLGDVLPKIEALGSRSGRTAKEIKIIKAAIQVVDKAQ